VYKRQDIGSSKTVAIIADNTENLTISGVGIAKSKGIKKGIITNIEEASKSIKQAVNDAKRVAGIEINKSVVSISSAYTKSIKSYGIVNIPNKEVTIKEINRAINSAIINAAIPNDYVAIQAIPYNFKLDDSTEIEDPVGMSGSRLEVTLHIIIAQKSGLDNLKKTFKQAGIEIEKIVNSGYASALAVLKEDEKELGVAVIDIGAATCDIAILVNKALSYTDYLPIGSHHITHDLSIALHTTLKDAEEIKLNFEKYLNNSEDLIEISVIGNENEKQKASISTITQVISARVEETFLLLNKKLDESKLKDKIGTGVVLTGGFTNFYNVKEIASNFFDGLPVRIGKPREIEGLLDDLKTPEFATSIGLILYANGENNKYEKDSNQNFHSLNLSETKEQENLLFKTEETEQKEEKEILAEIPKKTKNKTNPIKKFINWVNNLF
jgi:cell division protein FtsA